MSGTSFPTMTGSLMFQIKYPLQADEHNQAFEHGDLLHCSMLDDKGQIVSHCTMVVKQGFTPDGRLQPLVEYIYTAYGSSGVMPEVLEGCNALLAIQRNTPTGRSEATLVFFSKIHLIPGLPGPHTELNTDLGDRRVVEMCVAYVDDDAECPFLQGPLQIGHKWFFFMVTWTLG